MALQSPLAPLMALTHTAALGTAVRILVQSFTPPDVGYALGRALDEGSLVLISLIRSGAHPTLIFIPAQPVSWSSTTKLACRSRPLRT